MKTPEQLDREDMQERMMSMTEAQRVAVLRVAEEFGDFLYSHFPSDGGVRYVFRDRTFLSMAEVRAEATRLDRAAG